ncbi:hypothetical protein Leryth_022833 [Lithospermum erythrorhizon]|nr:hypothetical protein Leryth_022833 [Lithospermum erythrorhizon]
MDVTYRLDHSSSDALMERVNLRIQSFLVGWRGSLLEWLLQSWVLQSTLGAVVVFYLRCWHWNCVVETS